MSIRSLIIDDEELARKSLHTLIKESNLDLDVVGFAHSALSGAQAIIEHKPELIFLDVQMPNGDGFEMLDAIENMNFDVIFVTAHENFAHLAFKYEALDYLLKPVNPKDLINAVNRCKKRLTLFEKQNHRLNLVKSLSILNSKVPIPHKDGVKFLEIENVIRLEADGSYTTVYSTNERPQVVSKPLKFYSNLLNEALFVRVHRSHLINLKYIKEYKRDDGGFVLLQNGDLIHVADKKREMVLRKLSES